MAKRPGTGGACIMAVLAVVAANGGCTGKTADQPVRVAPEQPAVSSPATDEPDFMLSVNTLHDAPPDFAIQRIDSEDYPIPPYASYLEGVKVCLDPGHGGDAHKRAYKRGPTGVREAEMNLRVAQYLRDLLEHVGAEVLLTREDDTASGLETRAQVATDWGADLFISCHHNAIGKPNVNRTTVWYHLDVDYRPSNLDLARHLCQGLYDALQLPQITGVPLKSDQLMFKTGFGLLRHATVTTALCESSFFTNPEEEQRLRDPEYNLREAYGLFMGLARYAAGGLPRAKLAAPQGGVIATGDALELGFTLDDGLRSRKSWGSERQMILTSSIEVRVDGEVVPHTFTNAGYNLTAELPEGIEPGAHTVTVQFQNMYKHSVLNPHFEVEVE